MYIERCKQRLLDKERELRSYVTRLEGEVRASGEAEVRAVLQIAYGEGCSEASGPAFMQRCRNPGG